MWHCRSNRSPQWDPVRALQSAQRVLIVSDKHTAERNFFKWPQFTQFFHPWFHGVLKSGCGPELMTQGNTLMLVLPTWFFWTSHGLASSCPQVHKPLSSSPLPVQASSGLWAVHFILFLQGKHWASGQTEFLWWLLLSAYHPIPGSGFPSLFFYTWNSSFPICL